jgi:hypothetical protein
MKNIQKIINTIHKNWVAFNHHISSGSANSMITVACIVLSFTVVSINISEYRGSILEKQLELQNIKLLTTKEKTKQIIAVAKEEAKTKSEIERIKAEAMKQAAVYNLKAQEEHRKAEEARATVNPYVALAEHGKSTPTPVNVYINTNEDNNYVIHTSDGATEIAISTITVKGKKYTPEQRKLLEMAYYIGKEIGFPETIQSVLLQETFAGAYGDRIGDTNLPVGKRSYGVMQMKIATARKVLRAYPKLVEKYFTARKTLKKVRDEELIIKLIQDDEFNIRLAALNFAMHRKASKSWSQAVVAYNEGQGAANKIKNYKQHIYYKKVVKRLIKEVRPFNKKAKLSI